MDKSKAVRYTPLVALAMYLVFKLVPILSNLPDGPEPNVYTPTPTQQAQLLPVQKVLETYPDAREELGNMFYGLSTVIENDRRIFKTTRDVRDTHERAGALAVQTGQIPKIPGYPEAVGHFIELQVGNENVPLTDEMRSRIVDTFQALGWATK